MQPVSDLSAGLLSCVLLKLYWRGSDRSKAIPCLSKARMTMDKLHLPALNSPHAWQPASYC